MEQDPEATIQIQKTVNEYVKAQDIKTIDTSVVVSIKKTDQKVQSFTGFVKSFKRYWNYAPIDWNFGTTTKYLLLELSHT